MKNRLLVLALISFGISLVGCQGDPPPAPPLPGQNDKIGATGPHNIPPHRVTILPLRDGQQK